jgi:hypothetical protein
MLFFVEPKVPDELVISND